MKKALKAGGIARECAECAKTPIITNGEEVKINTIYIYERLNATVV